MLELGPGDEVIVTPQTFWATVRGLQAAGVTLRFGDIDPNTLNLDPATIEAKITPRTKAIYLVHLGGLMADMDPIMAIARKHNLYVVEDCAHAPGAEYKGRKAGSIGDIGCFSFHSLKNMTTLGEGGMITFNNDEWAPKVRPLTSIGTVYTRQARSEERIGPYSRSAYEYGDHSAGAFSYDAAGQVRVGNNYRMSEVAAAAGSVQLKKLDGFNQMRIDAAQRLNEGLAEIDGIRIQRTPVGSKHIYHLYVVFYQPLNEGSNREKEELIRILDGEDGIEIINRYFPIHLLPEIRCQGHGFGECPVAEKVWFEQHVNLPMYPTLTQAQVDYMIERVDKAVRKVRR
ncbi:MAG: DegT/DnrJ/EryC1/StrS family aminotransferase [Chloroflexi bacterium]|nr:MAG: DegT/DnrJ/EryC1/StrS family aminotransferase [Chloroflexota bacterium]